MFLSQNKKSHRYGRVIYMFLCLYLHMCVTGRGAREKANVASAGGAIAKKDEVRKTREKKSEEEID